MSARDVSKLLDRLVDDPTAAERLTATEARDLAALADSLAAVKRRQPKPSLTAPPADGVYPSGDRAVGGNPIGHREVPRPTEPEWPFPIPGGRFIADEREGIEVLATYDASGTPERERPTWVRQLRAHVKGLS